MPLDALDLPAEARAAVEDRAKAGGFPLTALIKDDDRCIRCGLCAIRCPTDAMTMERFQRVERFAAPPRPSPAPPSTAQVDPRSARVGTQETV